MAVLLFLMTSLLLYACWWSPRRVRDDALKQRLDGSRLSRLGTYGVNLSPIFNDMVQIARLDQSLVPSMDKSGPSRTRRLVFVGDVHGCKLERMKHPCT